MILDWKKLNKIRENLSNNLKPLDCTDGVY